MNRTLFILLCCSSVMAANRSEKDDAQIYSPVGKRDPFRAPSLAVDREVSSINPIDRFSLEQLQLRAILKGVGKSRAMFEDTDGNTHIITEGEIIARERATVSKILNKEVIVTEKTFNYLGEESLYEKVISLPVEEEVGEVSASIPPPPSAGPGVQQATAAGTAPEALPSSRQVLSEKRSVPEEAAPATAAPQNVPGAVSRGMPVNKQLVPFVKTVPSSASVSGEKR